MNNKHIPSIDIEIQKLINLSEYYINGGYKEKKYVIWYVIDYNNLEIKKIIKNKIFLKEQIKNIKNLNEKSGHINNLLLIDKDYINFINYNETKYLKSKEIMEEFSKKNKKKIDKLYYHISSKPIFNLINQKENYNRFGGKKNFNNFQIDLLDYSNIPYGLWISCGTSWLDFYNNSRYSNHDFIYSIRLNKKYNNKIKKISTKSSFSKFATKYNNKNATKLSDTIDWKKVKNDFDGLIICYNYENFNSYINNLDSIGIQKFYYHYLIDPYLKESFKEKYKLRNEWQRY